MTGKQDRNEEESEIPTKKFRVNNEEEPEERGSGTIEEEEVTKEDVVPEIAEGVKWEPNAKRQKR